MTRGKEAAAATARRLHAAESRIAELERELVDVRAAARRRELDLEEQLRKRGYDVMRRTADQVQEMMTRQMEQITDGLGNAVWRAQRVAMTEHLTWLFFKGYLKWDRFDGDYQMLHFIAMHGDLKAWFALTGQYGHHANYVARRQQKRRDPTLQMLGVLRTIERAEKGDVKAQQDRAKLDAVVELARDAFTNVELTEMLTDEGWVTQRPTEEDVAMHREILAGLPEFRALMERVEEVTG